MKKILLLGFLMVLVPFAAHSKRIDATVDAVDDLVTVLTVKQGGQNFNEVYKAKINIDGTFNGCTIHWLKSTDGGTNKSVVINGSGTTVTSAAEDFIPIELGWPSGSASTIIYASAAGCSSAPSLIIDIDDNLR